MTDQQFLYWIRDRLINVYHESPNTDFVTRLTAITEQFNHIQDEAYLKGLNDGRYL